MQHEHNEHHGPGMAARGVTRPMALSEIRDQQSDSGHDHGGHDRAAMLRMHHKQTLWVYWFLLMLGVWLVLNPLTFGYTQGTVQPSGGRSVWLTLSERAAAMQWSDILSGLLLIVFGWRSLRPNRPISLWICCFVGIWLTMAPVVFWSPTAAGFLNGSLVGMLVIGLTIMIPGMPNMIMFMAHGTTVPKGWSYNPSSWPQRWIMVAVAFVGYFVSRYLAAFQLGYLDFAWDPFFGDQTRLVLNSEMSHSMPVSDAAMGTAAYTFEFLMGFMGSPQRWRTMPWMVLVFGILVIPLGLVHIFLVISQPVVVGHWCTFCLLAAAVMLPMIPLAADEVVAMGQFMVQAKRKQLNLWKAFKRRRRRGRGRGRTQSRAGEPRRAARQSLRVVHLGHELSLDVGGLGGSRDWSDVRARISRGDGQRRRDEPSWRGSHLDDRDACYGRADAAGALPERAPGPGRRRRALAAGWRPRNCSIHQHTTGLGRCRPGYTEGRDPRALRPVAALCALTRHRRF